MSKSIGHMPAGRHTLHGRAVITADALFISGTIVAVPLVLSATALDPGIMPRLVCLNALLLGHSAVSTVLTRRFVMRLSTAAVMPVLYLFAVACSFFVAVNRGESAIDFVKISTAVLYCLTALSILLTTPSLCRFVFHAAAVGSLTISMTGLAQYLGFIDFPRGWGWPTSTLLNGNLLASYLLVSLGLCFGSFLTGGSRLKVIAAVSAVSGIAVIVTVASRAVWVAGACAATVAVAITLIVMRRAIMQPRVRRRALLVVVLAGSGLLIGAFLKQLDTEQPSVIDRARTLLDPDFASNTQRVSLWTKTITMIRDHLLTGVGAGNWKIMLPLYGTDDLILNNRELVEVRPYNDFLWIWAECGLAGFLFYLGIFAWGAVTASGIIRNKRHAHGRAIALCLLFSLLSLFIVSCFDFPRERIEHMILLFTIIALLGALAEHPRKIRIKSPWAAIAGICIPALLFTCCSLRWIQESKVVQVYSDRKSGDWTGLLGHAQSIDRRILSLDYAATPIDWYEAIAQCGLGRMEAAKPAFGKALHYHPQHLLSLHDLGSCYALTGNPDEAVRLYERALRLSPGFYEARKDQIAVLYSMGNYRQAMDEIDRYCSADTTFDNYRNAIRMKLAE